MKRLPKSVWVDLLLLVFVGALLLLQKPKPAESCGPMFDYAILHYTLHPDFPLDKFAAGHLGILEPTYARSYLTVAYRYMSGLTIDAKGQRSLNAMWEDRLGEFRRWEDEDQPRRKIDSSWQDRWESLMEKQLPWRANDERLFDTNRNEYSVIEKIVDHEFGRAEHYPDTPRWHRREELEAKLYPATLKLQIEEARKHHTFEYVFEGAFENAVITHRSLAHQYGAKSPEAFDWVATMDTVLSNLALPSQARSDASTTLRKNREYLIGASLFYRGEFNLARERFFSIAGDISSPWHDIAPYMAARTLVREALLADDSSPIFRPALKEAIRELNLILGSQPKPQVRDWTLHLLRTARAHYDWNGRCNELAVNILLPHVSDSIADLVVDYTATMDHTLEDAGTRDRYWERPAFDRLPKDRGEDMTDWIETFQTVDSGARVYVFDKWQKKKTLQWLVSAISRATIKDKIANALIAASENISAANPAYQMVRYHQARLLMAKGEEDRARTVIDAVLDAARNQYFPASSRNQFHELRLNLARNYDEMVAFLERRPAAISGDESGAEIPYSAKDKDTKQDLKFLTPLDESGVQLLNYSIPNAYFARLGATQTFSHELRARLCVTGWVRAVLTAEDELAQQCAAMYVKEMPTKKSLFSRYLAAKTASVRHFEAIDILLRSSGFSPYFKSGLNRFEDDNEVDHFRDNWWVSEEYEHSGDSLDEEYMEHYSFMHQRSSRASLHLAFLSPDEQHTESEELTRIRKVGAAPAYLNSETLALAKASPNDPRIPEMLHLAVRSGRYIDDPASKDAEATFKYLHSHYPKSPWAKKTKYWF